MSSRILTLDIEGSLTALSSSSRGVGTWAITILPALAAGQIPSGITLSVDPATGSSDAGGLTLRCTDISSLLNDIGVLHTTTVATAADTGDTSITVADASGLAASGYVWIGREAIAYSGVTVNTLTGCTRAALGTVAAQHSVGDKVYASNPNIIGRKATLLWQDGYTPSTTTQTRFVGFIDSFAWEDGYYAIVLISAQKLAMDEKALATEFITGSLLHNFPSSVDLYLDHDGDTAWTAYPNTRGFSHVQIDDEIIRIEQTITPAFKQTIGSYASPNRLFVGFPSLFKVGQIVDITNSSGTVKVTGVTVAKIYDNSSATSYVEVTGITSYTWASGDLLAANYTSLIPVGRLKRGEFGTQKLDHEEGADANEVRVFEGDLAQDILLPLLLSVDGGATHGPSAGAYDILPDGWGLALDSSFLDMAALLKLDQSGRPSFRRYLYTAPVSISELLTGAAQTINASIFWSEAGQLTATLRDDLYPGHQDTQVFSPGSHRDGAIPRLEVRMDRVYNAAVAPMDRNPVTGEPRHSLQINFSDSIARYGRREIQISDAGLWRGSSEAGLQQSLYGWLLYRGLPYPEVVVSAVLDENITYRPGDTVSMILSHLPNMAGEKGLAGSWEIIEVSPSDAEGRVDLRLIYRGLPPRLGYVSLSGIVSSLPGSPDVIIEAAATTEMAQASPYIGSSYPAFVGDGIEDIDWFLEGDLITFWDVSTFGGAVTTASGTVSSIDYAARKLTMSAALPGWLAAGDLITLRDWPGTSASPNVAERQGVYLALADSTASPPDLGAGDEAYLWGL